MLHRTLELGVRLLHENDASVSEPYDDNVKSLIHKPTFLKLPPVGMWGHIRYIWKLSNQAVH